MKCEQFYHPKNRFFLFCYFSLFNSIDKKNCTLELVYKEHNIENCRYFCNSHVASPSPIAHPKNKALTWYFSNSFYLFCFSFPTYSNFYSITAFYIGIRMSFLFNFLKNINSKEISLPIPEENQERKKCKKKKQTESQYNNNTTTEKNYKIQDEFPEKRNKKREKK